MCGVAGYWSFRGEPNREWVKSALAAIAHRGPDSSGVWVSTDKSLELGHVRLAIQDLSPLGHQPMVSDSGRYVVVFNGEIYNFRRLSKELTRLGAVFRGHSDTEVMLAAFDIWGVEASLARFDGMFAFGVYDNVERELWLVRDRLGEKPLYYTVDQDGFAFCSELKGLLYGSNRKYELDFSAQSFYFQFGYFSVEDTPFSAIKKLPPASFLRVNALEVKRLSDIRALQSHILRYWSLPRAEPSELPPHKLVDILEEKLISTVQDQAIADVDLGVFLSGGVDSTLIAALLQKNSGKQISTYTVAFNSKAYNEAPFAAEIAAHIGSNHHEIPLDTADCLQVIHDASRLFDEPFADASLIPTYLVCREARKHVKVCLSGDGGDELFGGYNRYIWGQYLQRKFYSWPLMFRVALSGVLAAVPSAGYDALWKIITSLRSGSGALKYEKDVGAKAHKLARALRLNDEAELYMSLMSFWHEMPLLNRRDVAALDYFPQFAGSADFAEASMRSDLGSYLVNDNLFKVDRAAMASSLEVRLPLLGRDIVEFSTKVPMDCKIKGSVSKWILRQVLYRHVSSSLIDRPKMGFSMPLAEWFRADLKQWGENILTRKDLLEGVGLNRELISSVWAQHLAGSADQANALWSIFAYIRWMDAYSEFIADR